MAEKKQSSDAQGKDKDEKKDEGVCYVGVDFGTSRTSVSASNGVRATVLSYVGYPRDVVARKLLQKDKLFGQEAFDKQLSLKFYRPLGGGAIKYKSAPNEKDAEYQENLKAAQDLLAHAVSLARARQDELVYAVIGVPAQASIHNKQAILNACKDGVDSVMLCSEPFAVAYGLDRLDDVLVIDIGAGTTDLCRMHGTMPEDSDQITMSYAGDYLDQEIYNLVKKEYPQADFTTNMIKQVKEKHSTVNERTEQIVVDFPVNGKPTPFDVTSMVKDGLRKIIPPIVEGLHKLIASFHPEFQAKLRNNVLLGGGGSQIEGLDLAIERYMKDQLGSGRVQLVEEPIYQGANGALKIAHDMPEEYWQKLK